MDSDDVEGLLVEMGEGHYDSYGNFQHGPFIDYSDMSVEDDKYDPDDSSILIAEDNPDDFGSPMNISYDDIPF